MSSTQRYNEQQQPFSDSASPDSLLSPQHCKAATTHANVNKQGRPCRNLSHVTHVSVRKLSYQVIPVLLPYICNTQAREPLVPRRVLSMGQGRDWAMMDRPRRPQGGARRMGLGQGCCIRLLRAEWRRVLGVGETGVGYIRRRRGRQLPPAGRNHTGSAWGRCRKRMASC